MMGKQVRETKQNSPPTSTSGQFDPRPFAPPVEEHESPSREFLERASRFGYSFGEVSIIPRQVIQPNLVSGPPRDFSKMGANTHENIIFIQNHLQHSKFIQPHHIDLRPNSLINKERIKNARDQLDDYSSNEGILQLWQQKSEGRPMLASSIENWSRQLGTVLPHVYIHRDELANRLTAARSADAITLGNHIYFGKEAFKPSIIAHEMTHVAQANLRGRQAETSLREREACQSQPLLIRGQSYNVKFPGPATEPMSHPAARILIRAGRWLLRRTTNTISKHIARHGRRIAGRAVHSVFRNPREIRYLVSRTIRDATALAQRATTHGAEDVISQGGLRVFRQATRTPGKFRYVLENDLGRAIGTRGERILRLIIDESGRLVTAFPVDRFMALGLTAGAATIFGERAATASERVRERIEAEENRPTDWIGEILDFLNPLSGGSLNEGEDLMLDVDRIIAETTNQVIREIEETENVILNQDQRRAIRDLVEVGVGSPLELEDIEED
jgi:hypothetical protein